MDILHTKSSVDHGGMPPLVHSSYHMYGIFKGIPHLAFRLLNLLESENYDLKKKEYLGDFILSRNCLARGVESVLPSFYEHVYSQEKKTSLAFLLS